MTTFLDHSLGLAVETAWDTAKAVDHHYEWLGQNGLNWDPNVVQGKGLRQGSTFPRSGRRVRLVGMGNGKFGAELASKGFGLWLQLAFGTLSTTNVSGALYQQLATATVSSPYLDSFTAQEGLVNADGTIDAFTWRGCHCKSLEIDMPSSGIATITMDVDARHAHPTRTVADGVTTISDATFTSATGEFDLTDVGAPISGTGIPANTTIASINSTTSVEMSAAATASGTGLAVTIGSAYVTPTYPSVASTTLYNAALPLTNAMVIGGTMTVPTTTALGSISGGSTASGVKAWNFTMDNNLDVKRDTIGGRNRANVQGRTAKLKTTVEYDAATGRTLNKAYFRQSPLPVLLNATTEEIITAGNPATFQLACPVAYIDSGAVPMPTEGEVIKTDIEWSILDGLTNNTVYGVLHTADTAA